jgi:hypothetical protein
MWTLGYGKIQLEALHLCCSLDAMRLPLPIDAPVCDTCVNMAS